VKVLKPAPGPAYRIHTRRLVLRCWEPADAPMLKNAIQASLDHLRPWMPWAHNHPEDLQATIERLRRWRSQFDQDEDYVYGVFNPDESAVLGSTGLHTRVGKHAREIGYWIHASHINQGLATEVSAALTKVAFAVDKVQRIEIHCNPRNDRSAAVPRKLGFTYEATLRQRTRSVEGKLVDAMIWTLLAGEYPTSPAADVPIEAFDVIGRRVL
jgi:RimJ/RimL family protein N-acetyltransferase